MFGAKKLPSNWIELKTLADLEAAHLASFKRPVVLFKHSVTCGISAFAKERISDLAVNDTFQFYYIDLLSYREISNEIARKLGVIHQSPQVIVVKQGQAVFTTSHHSINQEVILENL